LGARLERAESRLASERQVNDELRTTVARLRHRVEEATRTLDGAWSCLPHRVVRWVRGRLAGK